ncbi:MAG: carbohydrate kinase [Gammaproteobacteria bacterium]|nr:carbohydrate kinase [Gammaproteobacteria bacterium]
MFLSCGDALFDLFAQTDADDKVGSAVHLSGNVGGSPMNVAAGLARLGHHSRYFTKLSTDVFGQRMRRYLQHNKIDVTLCPDTNLNTTLAIVETRDDGSAQYAFYTDNTADVSIVANDLPSTLPDDIRVLHFGSYSTAVEPTSASLITLAAREKTRRLVSYDPNLRPTIEPDVDKWRDVFQSLAASATLVKASDEDIETLFGPSSEERFVADCFSSGAQLVFITRGPEGASGFLPDGTSARMKGIAVDVIDTVGAGDTFQSATLHWLAAHNHIGDSAELNGEVDLSGCIQFAIKAAAITCTRKGADLPYLYELPAI